LEGVGVGVEPGIGVGDGVMLGVGVWVGVGGGGNFFPIQECYLKIVSCRT